MVAPAAPTNLSAQATNLSTTNTATKTVILTWNAPPTASPPVTTYKINRNLRNVASFTDILGGTNYDPNSPPKVTIQQKEGNQATAVATVVGDAVTSIAVTYGGTLYTGTPPSVTIDPPPIAGTTATATAVLSITDEIDSIAVLTPPTFTNTSLEDRQTPFYTVIAVNGTGDSPPSNTASATTSSSQAQTIQELLFNNWSLTGELAKQTIGNMTEPVRFFDRGQVPGNKFPKAVVVQKINALGNENIIEHPRFFEQSDIFEITCFLQVTDSGDDEFSDWIDFMEQMTGEVTRILKTQFSPSSGTGEFFRTTTGWSRDDTFLPDDPELTRTLQFTLTRILSNDPEVFVGYPGQLGTSGVLVFSVVGSVGDSKPVSDYIYTQTERIQIIQGWRNIPYLTTNGTSETGVPIYYRGQYGGRFSCNMFLKKSDITPFTLNSLSQIFRPQNNGELGTAFFLQNSANSEINLAGDDNFFILTESFPVNITEIEKISENEELVKFNIRGNLVDPSIFKVFTEFIDMAYEDGALMIYEDSDKMIYE